MGSLSASLGPVGGNLAKSGGVKIPQPGQMGQMPGQPPGQPPAPGMPTAGTPVATPQPQPGPSAGAGGAGGPNAVTRGVLGGLPGLMKKQVAKPLTAQGALGKQPAQSMWQRMMPTIGALRDRGAMQAAAAAQPLMQQQQPQQQPDQHNLAQPEEEPV